MESIQYPHKQRKPLRAMVEILGAELKIFPIADSDAEEQKILDALRFVREDAAEK